MVTRTLKELDNKTLIVSKGRGGFTVTTEILKQLFEIIEKQNHTKVLIVCDLMSQVDGGYKTFRSLLNATCIPHTCSPTAKAVIVKKTEGINAWNVGKEAIKQDIEFRFILFTHNRFRPDGVPCGYAPDWHVLKVGLR
jgi:hypothetical protein